MEEWKQAANAVQEAMQKTLSNAQKQSQQVQEEMKKAVATAQEKIAALMDEGQKAYDAAQAQARDKMDQLQRTMDDTKKKCSDEEKRQLQQIEQLLQRAREDLRSGAENGLERAREQLKAANEQLQLGANRSRAEWHDVITRATNSAQQICLRYSSHLSTSEQDDSQLIETRVIIFSDTKSRICQLLERVQQNARKQQEKAIQRSNEIAEEIRRKSEKS